MMSDKPHEEYIGHLKDIKSISVIDIPNTPNSISGKDLREIYNFPNVQYKENIKQAIKSAPLKKVITS